MSELDLGVGMPQIKNREELLEMELLPANGHINDFGRVPCLPSVAKGRQIGRRVIGCAITLLHQGRMCSQFRDIIEKYNDSSFAPPRHAKLTQLFDHVP